MALSILIHHIPGDLKLQIERLPEYEYGYVNGPYIKMLRFYLQSPEMRLATINQRVTNLEPRIDRLIAQVERLARVMPQIETLLLKMPPSAPPGTSPAADNSEAA